MKNIAILTCLKAGRVCSGAACMRAFNEKSASFAAYDEPISLVAFLQCNGCDAAPDDEELARKLGQLEKVKTDCVHIGICTETKPGTECETISRIAADVAARGIAVTRGTHG